MLSEVRCDAYKCVALACTALSHRIVPFGGGGEIPARLALYL